MVSAFRVPASQCVVIAMDDEATRAKVQLVAEKAAELAVERAGEEMGEAAAETAAEMAGEAQEARWTACRRR